MSDGRKLEVLLAQLATWLRSGAPGVVILPTLQALAPASLRAPLGHALTGSTTLSVALASSGHLSAAERALLEAGEASGRLPDLLDALAHMRAQQRLTRRQLAAGLAYPALLVVLGGFLLTAPLVVSRGVGAWLSVAVWPLVVVSALAVVFVVVAPRLSRNAWLVTAPRHLALRLPLVGPGFARASLASFCDVLAHLLGAGMPYMLALPAALHASADDGLVDKERKVMRALDGGATLTEALRRADALPSRLLATLAAAEQSGTLERALKALGRDEAESYRRFLRTLVTFTVAAVFAVVASAIAATLVVGAASFFDRIDATVAPADE